MCWTTGKQTLVECEACKRPVSIEAASCPGCGHPRVPASVKGLIRCVSCNQPHAIDATVCPRCGQPHDPVATRAGIEAEKAKRRNAGAAGVGLTAATAAAVLGVVIVVLPVLCCCMAGQPSRRTEFVTLPDPVVSPLPAEAPPPVEPERHD